MARLPRVYTPDASVLTVLPVPLALRTSTLTLASRAPVAAYVTVPVIVPPMARAKSIPPAVAPAVTATPVPVVTVQVCVAGHGMLL